VSLFLAMKYALFLVALVMMSAFYVEGDDDGVNSLLGLFLLNFITFISISMQKQNKIRLLLETEKPAGHTGLQEHSHVLTVMITEVPTYSIVEQLWYYVIHKSL